MQDYGLSLQTTPISVDNSAAISITHNWVVHSRTKHIVIKHHFIRDCCEKKIIDLEKIDSLENLADLFTKSFDKFRFNYLLQLIGMINPE